MPVLSQRTKSLVALLGSDNDGEALNAARALKVALRKDGMDFHDLASGGARVAERIVYRTEPCERCAAWARDRAKRAPSTRLADIKFVAGYPSLLSEREQEFVTSILDQAEKRELTDKQAAWFETIFTRIKKKTAQDDDGF